MLLSLVFSLYLLLSSATSAAVVQSMTAVHDPVASVADGQTPSERTDRLRGIEDHRHRSEAVLSNARGMFRVGASRPQRLLPVYGSKNNRTLGKYQQQPKFNLLNISWLSYSRQALPAAMHGSASCEYYVFALRRILC